MSAKNEKDNVDKPADEQNDWDDDDNWDEWGDAEDNSAEEQQPTKDEQQKVKNTPAQQLKESSDKANEKQDHSSYKDELPSSSSQIPRPPPQPEKSWGLGVFSGVVSSVLSTASDITSTVSQGLNQVIGVPDPEELARMHASEKGKEEPKEKPGDEDKDEEEEKNKVEIDTRPPGAYSTVLILPGPTFGAGLVNGVTSLGSKVINTGLDTLEGIGKKTMNILQENDPMLINKRKMLGLEPDRPNLSAVLKEAKEDADQMEITLKKLKFEQKKAQMRFDYIFDNLCGQMHFEALEILSKETALKVEAQLESVSGIARTELNETIQEVGELMLLEFVEGESKGTYDPTELNDRLVKALEDTAVKMNFDDIVSVYANMLEFLNSLECKALSDLDLYGKGVHYLAETAALEMNKLHKLAEMFLVKENHSTASEFDTVVQLSTQFSSHLQGITHCFAFKLTDRGNKSHVTALFGEMIIALARIEKAYALFLPILQIGAI